MKAEECSIDVFVKGSVWWQGNRMPPEDGYHCVFSGDARSYSESDNLSVSQGAAEESLDWDDAYILHDGKRYAGDMTDLPCDW